MGTYGMLRFNLGLFPEQARRNAPWIMTLALIGIIYGALVAMVQPNMKKLIAYSSVSHLGFVVLGIFSFTTSGLNGAMFVMLAHGISTGGLFMLAGILHERRHTYEISEFGGLASTMPVYATSYLLILLASVGLPLLNGFIGEFLVLNGAFQAKPIYGILAATGVIWSACYLLWMFQRVFYGKVTHPINNSLADMLGFEKAAVWPCAAAAVKAMKPADVRASGADIILGNTYHLMLRPGAERVARLGGLHEFMGWERPILTDSGGYQVMSLVRAVEAQRGGVAFASHLDGSRHMLSPERSMEVQTLLGSDIVMAFDQLIKTTESREAQVAAMERSMRWAGRSREAFDALGNAGALFGIQQGGLDEGAAPGLGRGADRDRLRRLCGRRARGGGGAGGDVRLPRFRARPAARGPAALSDGRRQAGRHRRRGRARHRHVRLRAADPLRPDRAGLHLGRPDQHPQREIRRGRGRRSTRTRRPPHWSKAYLHHLVRSGEILGAMLMTEHNLWFYQRLMQESARRDRRSGGWPSIADAFRARYKAGRDAA